MALVDLKNLTGDFEIDLKYATEDNFTGSVIYQSQHAFLHQDAEKCLQIALELANRIGFGIRIFDAFRPMEAQFLLFDHTPDPDFLALPSNGSPHSRGVAIDLTLYDIKTGQDLDMGTEFDAFTPKSHHGADGLSPLHEKNRFTLLGIMTTAGFDFFRNEWWHYQLFKARSFPLLSDIDAPARLLNDSQIENARKLARTAS